MNLEKIFSDPAGVNSLGRVIAAYLVVLGVLAFPVAFLVPNMAAYVTSFTDSCFGYGAVFYGSAKGYDIFNAVRGRLSQWVGKKFSSGSTEAPSSPEPEGDK